MSDNQTENTIEFLRAAHSASFENEESIIKSLLCGCFYCERIFPPSEIGDEDWLDDQNARMAVCPHCGIDSVIGDDSGFLLTASFLHEMYLVWFKNSRHDELWA